MNGRVAITVGVSNGRDLSSEVVMVLGVLSPNAVPEAGRCLQANGEDVWREGEGNLLDAGTV